MIENIIDFNFEVVQNPVFNDPNAETLIFTRKLPEKPNTKWFDSLISNLSYKKEDDSISLDVDKLCNLGVQLLTKEEEETLFLQLNLSLYSLKIIKEQGLNDNNRADYLKWFKRYKEAEEYLANANLALVISIIRKKFLKTGIPFNDLVSEGNLALLKAIRKFDISLGYKFSTYATWAIVNAILKAIQNKNEDTSFAPVSIDEALTSGSVLVAEENEKTLQLDFIRQVIRNNDAQLSEIELEIIKLRYLNDSNKVMTREEIGQKLNLSRETARQCEFKAVEKIRKFIENRQNNLQNEELSGKINHQEEAKSQSNTNMKGEKTMANKLIYVDANGAVLKEVAKGKGRPPRGAVKQDNGDFIVHPVADTQKVAVEYITVNSAGAVVDRSPKTRGRTKPGFVKQEAGEYAGNWVKFETAETVVAATNSQTTPV